MDGVLVELNFRKCKWLLFGTYHHHPKQICIIYYSRRFNTETSEPRIDSLIYEHDLQNLVKAKTCFKGVENPSCMDLILTNNAMAFQNTATIFTGLSDFHKLVFYSAKN